MIQLQLNFEKNKIDMEKINYWQVSADINPKVKNYLIEELKKVYLKDYDTNTLYCSNCLHKLNSLGICENCQESFDIKNRKNEWLINIKKPQEISYGNSYLVFDTPDKEIVLYVINVEVNYTNPLTTYLTKTIYFKIESCFHILKDKCINLMTNKTYKYKDIANKIAKEDNLYYVNIDNYFDYHNYCSYLYTDNLENLKDTIYRYTHLWESAFYLNHKPIHLFNVVYFPLYYKGFEYLMKHKFYSLAFNDISLIKYDREEKVLLNPKGEYLDFMIKNNFDYNAFLTLKICKIKNMELINYMKDAPEELDYILKFKKIKVLELWDYLKSNHVSILDYNDYIKMAEYLGYDLKNKKVLYPEDFYMAHDEAIENNNQIVSKNYNKKIKKLAKYYEKNKYEDKNYVIYPASSVEEMLKEGKAQNNCLRMYIEDYGKNNLQIYFMRKKKNLNKSFVTIEVKNNKIVQARLKNNLDVPDDIQKILDIWTKKLQ